MPGGCPCGYTSVHVIRENEISREKIIMKVRNFEFERKCIMKINKWVPLGHDIMVYECQCDIVLNKWIIKN